jgi:hypothetical protein
MKKLFLLLLLLLTSAQSGFGQSLNKENELIYNSLDSVFRFYYPITEDDDKEFIPEKVSDRIRLLDLCSNDMSPVDIINFNSEFEAYYVWYYCVNDGRDYTLLKIGNEYSLYNWDSDKIKVLKLVNKLIHKDNPILSKERWYNLVNNLLTYRDRKYYPVKTTIGNLQIYFDMKKYE